MSTSASANAWVVTWRERAIDGFTDYFPAGSLGQSTARITHLVVGPRGWRGLAACSVQANGNVVTLDYHPFRKENEAGGMEIGVLRLTFAPNGRSVIAATWNGKKAPVDISIGLPPELPVYKPKAGKLRRITSTAVRGPQGRFRTTVRAAYGDRCAITGCDISEALEAAHIDPFENPSQHHPSNGLLLRSDLHSLLDRGLLAIEPVTGRVHVHPSLHRYAEYQQLHGRRLRVPEDGFGAYAPSAQAVARRWKIWEREAAV